MGFPWKKVLSVATGVGSMFVPGLDASIQAVEAVVSAKGDDKKTAAIAAATAIVQSIDGAAGKDVLNDSAVVKATSEAVDAIVAAYNAKAKLQAAIDAAKAAKSSGA